MKNLRRREDRNIMPVFFVVLAVCLNSSMGLLGLLILSWQKIEVNDAVIAIISSLCGSLCTLLTTTRGTDKPDGEPIAVKTEKGDALDVRDIEGEGEPEKADDAATDGEADPDAEFRRG